jgi:hypothetical protein
MPPIAIAGGLALGGAVASGIANRNQANHAADQANANRQYALDAIDANSPEALLRQYGEGTVIGDFLRNEELSENWSNTSSSSTTRKFVQEEYKPTEENLKSFWNNLMSGDKFSSENIAKLNASLVNDTYGGIEDVLGDKISALGLGSEGGGAALGFTEAGRARDIVRGRLGAEREALGYQMGGAQGLQSLLGMAGIGTRTNSSSSTRSGTTGGLSPGQQLLLDQHLAGNRARAGLGAPSSAGGLGNSILGGVGQMAGSIGMQGLGQASAGYFGG